MGISCANFGHTFTLSWSSAHPPRQRLSPDADAPGSTPSSGPATEASPVRSATHLGGVGGRRAVLVALASVSLWGVSRTPGNENFQAKWADWLRSHRAALIANAIEQYYYDHHFPPKGGRPAGLNVVPAPPRPSVRRLWPGSSSGRSSQVTRPAERA